MAMAQQFQHQINSIKLPSITCHHQQQQQQQQQQQPSSSSSLSSFNSSPASASSSSSSSSSSTNLQPIPINNSTLPIDRRRGSITDPCLHAHSITQSYHQFNNQRRGSAADLHNLIDQSNQPHPKLISLDPNLQSQIKSPKLPLPSITTHSESSQLDPNSDSNYNNHPHHHSSFSTTHSSNSPTTLPSHSLQPEMLSVSPQPTLKRKHSQSTFILSPASTPFQTPINQWSPYPDPNSLGLYDHHSSPKRRNASMTVVDSSNTHFISRRPTYITNVSPLPIHHHHHHHHHQQTNEQQPLSISRPESNESNSFNHQQQSISRRESDGSSLYELPSIFSDSDHAHRLRSVSPLAPSTWTTSSSPQHKELHHQPMLNNYGFLPNQPTTIMDCQTNNDQHVLENWSTLPFQLIDQTSNLNSNGPQLGLNPNPTSSYSRSTELKVSHKLAERKRRKEMKDLFDELKLALPTNDGLHHSSDQSFNLIDHNKRLGNKCSKWEILSCAVEFLYQLRNENDGLKEENKTLKTLLNQSQSTQSQSWSNTNTQIGNPTENLIHNQTPSSTWTNNHHHEL
ncbi:hypothetical protein CROQUDRAFT_660441 [Cronartium quercuum f. sp. fusiforme G11]|uniref:BHLH domain-containing protein n=1 Tax=Cronartium quercuum f. sp. fusiforme G11 TaxID=708437 RepID=A0A9P6NI61_9BASI|nr:hypothetical protein CROQUDRAFT_660441 [Cronartium quercuum f. sp. fusiforme G11]